MRENFEKLQQSVSFRLKAIFDFSGISAFLAILKVVMLIIFGLPFFVFEFVGFAFSLLSFLLPTLGIILNYTICLLCDLLSWFFFYLICLPNNICSKKTNMAIKNKPKEDTILMEGKQKTTDIQSNYYDYTKVGLLVARGKFDISVYDTGYSFDAQKTFLLIENISSIIGVFSKDDNLFQEGILTCMGECFYLEELETELKSVATFYSFKKNGDLIIAYDSKKICYAFCKYNFSFLLTFPRRLINYSDENDVDYVSRIEDENEAFAIHLLKNLTLAEKVYLNNEDKNFLQAFCADFANSDFSKNAMDDFCFANTVSVVSKKILLGLKEYIQNMVEVFSKANISDNYKERIEKVIITINKYL